MKTAFVTGGSRGIGKSIALDLGKKFHVVVGYSVSDEKAKGPTVETSESSSSSISISNSSSKAITTSTIPSESISSW